MRKMLLVPVGGLANRMRAVASAYTLMQQLGGELRVVWFRDWALNAPFGDLFEPVSERGVSVREASLKDLLVYDRPRKHNFYIPVLFQKLLFHSCMYERKVGPLCYQESFWRKWASQGKVYMASYDQFMAYDNRLVQSMFRPVDLVRREVERRCSLFSDYTIGLHIRRTDNVVSIRQSPLELFYSRLDEELDAHAGLCIYLATDSEEVKSDLRGRYGKRLLVADAVADRGSVRGIQDAVVDMFTLSRTSKIYGSSGSSFSELAAQLGDVMLEIVRR